MLSEAERRGSHSGAMTTKPKRGTRRARWRSRPAAAPRLLQRRLAQLPGPKYQKGRPAGTRSATRRPGCRTSPPARGTAGTGRSRGPSSGSRDESAARSGPRRRWRGTRRPGASPSRPGRRRRADQPDADGGGAAGVHAGTGSEGHQDQQTAAAPGGSRTIARRSAAAGGRQSRGSRSRRSYRHRGEPGARAVQRPPRGSVGGLGDGECDAHVAEDRAAARVPARQQRSCAAARRRRPDSSNEQPDPARAGPAAAPVHQPVGVRLADEAIHRRRPGVSPRRQCRAMSATEPGSASARRRAVEGPRAPRGAACRVSRRRSARSPGVAAMTTGESGNSTSATRVAAANGRIKIRRVCRRRCAATPTTTRIRTGPRTPSAPQGVVLLRERAVRRQPEGAVGHDQRGAHGLAVDAREHEHGPGVQVGRVQPQPRGPRG